MIVTGETARLVLGIAVAMLAMYGAGALTGYLIGYRRAARRWSRAIAKYAPKQREPRRDHVMQQEQG